MPTTADGAKRNIYNKTRYIHFLSRDKQTKQQNKGSNRVKKESAAVSYFFDAFADFAGFALLFDLPPAADDDLGVCDLSVCDLGVCDFGVLDLGVGAFCGGWAGAGGRSGIGKESNPSDADGIGRSLGSGRAAAEASGCEVGASCAVGAAAALSVAGGTDEGGGTCERRAKKYAASPGRATIVAIVMGKPAGSDATNRRIASFASGLTTGTLRSSLLPILTSGCACAVSFLSAKYSKPTTRHNKMRNRLSVQSAVQSANKPPNAERRTPNAERRTPNAERTFNH